MEVNEKYMRRALQLASNGILDASPNPMVGAVIVSPDGKIIGEGWHRKCGEGHAEVNAVASVKDKELLKDATMYVTLEPCSHYGKTPPCAQLIIDTGIPRVVVGSLDPFPKVSGRGVKMLTDAGVEVVTGILEKECRGLNVRFMRAHSLGRPYITLKWAQSSDGYIDGKISTPLTSMLVHRLRATHDAIMVGSQTYLTDHPGLDTRLFAGNSPQRIVLDRRGRITASDDDNPRIISARVPLIEIMQSLYSQGITSVLVEGGATLLESFIHDDLWDTIRIETGNEKLEGKVRAPGLCIKDYNATVETIDGNRIFTIDR